MKCMVIAFIKSGRLLSDLEGIMHFHRFYAIESNTCFRVFLGHINPNARHLADSLNTQLENTGFDVEDSLFIVYPSLTYKKAPSLSNIIIKRKGNKYLRRDVLDNKKNTS